MILNRNISIRKQNLKPFHVQNIPLNLESDGEAPVLELGECEVLSGSLWPGLVVPVMVPPKDQIELFDLLEEIVIAISYWKPYGYVQIIYIRYEYLINRIKNVV